MATTRKKRATKRTPKAAPAPKPEVTKPAPEATNDEDTPARTMSRTLAAHKGGYVPTTTHRGTKSLNNGDRVAKLLAGLDPLTVAAIADTVLGEEAGHHARKYEHLNPGQVRMNSGNRIRAHAKKGDGELADVVAAAEQHGIVDAAAKEMDEAIAEIDA